ncbi:MAG: hypothetical protein DHS20C18_56110 [Saprospiraceae bacterium]|nr:MAG: hypothetical protein DHS20C18_56110 [Saprospiraceae bacterium]
MKKITLLLAVIVAFCACNNIEQMRQPILDLAANWEGTTAQVTELMGKLNSEQLKASSMVKRMEISDSSAQTMTEEVKQQAAGLQETFKGKMGELDKLKGEISGFLSSLQEKSADVQALKQGLEAGQMPDGAAGTMKNLQEMMSTATTNIGNWATQFDGIRTGFSEAYNKFNEIKGTFTEGNTGSDS